MELFELLVRTLLKEKNDINAMFQCRRFRCGYEEEQSRRPIKDVLRLDEWGFKYYKMVFWGPDRAPNLDTGETDPESGWVTDGSDAESDRDTDRKDPELERLQLDGLHYAILARHKTACALISRCHEEIDKRVTHLDFPYWITGPTALHLAITLAHWDLAEILIDSGSGINTTYSPLDADKFEKEMTCLHIACFDGSENLVQFVLARGANVRQYSAIPTAVAALKSGDEEKAAKILPLLLEAGADVNAVVTETNEYTDMLHKPPAAHQQGCGAFRGMSCLHVAACYAWETCVKIALNYGAQVEYPAKRTANGLYKGSALHVIITNPCYGDYAKVYLPMLKFFVDEAGADVLRRALYRTTDGKWGVYTPLSLLMSLWRKEVDEETLNWLVARTLKAGVERKDIAAVEHAV